MTEPELKFVTGDELTKELRVRRSPWLNQTVQPPMVNSLLEAGWTIERRNKSSVRLRKPKPIDQALEDDVWALLARVGFTHLSQGRRFAIPVAKTERDAATKQIDVLAADAETILVVECKSAASVVSRSMGKDLLEAKPPRPSVRSHPAALRHQEARGLALRDP